jgi:hypothetical protein
MSIETLVAAPVTLPRVNLLPREANAADAARKVKLILAGVLVVVLGGVGYVYTGANSSVDDAQAQLDAAEATTAKLKTQVAAHGTVTPLKAQLDVRTQLMKTAMGLNVPWATYLNDVQLNLPRGARLVGWTIQLAPPALPGAGAATVFASNGVAMWTMTGEAKKFEDVALVVESLSQLSQVDSVLVTKATEAIDSSSGRPLVSFTLSARVNSTALVPYNPKAGR